MAELCTWSLYGSSARAAGIRLSSMELQSLRVLLHHAPVPLLQNPTRIISVCLHMEVLYGPIQSYSHYITATHPALSVPATGNREVTVHARLFLFISMGVLSTAKHNCSQRVEHRETHIHGHLPVPCVRHRPGWLGGSNMLGIPPMLLTMRRYIILPCA